MEESFFSILQLYHSQEVNCCDKNVSVSMCRYPTERYFANALFQCVCVCVSDFLEFAWHGLYCLIIYRISMKRIITSKKLTNHHINRICTIFRLYLGVCVCVFFSLLQALLYTQHKFHLILVSASLGSSICVWYRLGMGWEKNSHLYQQQLHMSLFNAHR